MKKGALLWQILRESSPEPSYLFGTMHVKDPVAFGRIEVIYQKITECDLFCTEISLDMPTDIPITTFLLPAGKSLDQFIPEKKYAKLKHILSKAFGMDLDKMKFFKPIVIANMIDEMLLQNEMPEALDRHLWNFAKELGKTCLGIEEMSDQIALLQQVPLDQQVKGLLSAGRHVSSHRRRVRTLTRAYEQGDIYRIYQMARRGGGKIRHAMIFNRNQHMADRLAELMQEKSLFFAVGAGHLAGGKGVIRMLKRHGFRLRPIS